MSPKVPRPAKRPLRPSEAATAKRKDAAALDDSNRHESWRNLHEDGFAALFLLALAAVYFVPVLAAGNSLVLSAAGTDIWSQYFYWRAFGFNALGRGELPLWNPYIFSGAPYIAGIQSAIFYPLNVVFLFLETPIAINFSIALHCWLASGFTYLFARYQRLTSGGALLSAITFAYGAPYFFHIYPGHLSNLSTMTWLPLLFLGVEAFLRNQKIKYVLLSGVPLSMQVLAGHPQYLFYSVIALSIYFGLRLWSTKALRQAPFFIFGFCLFVFVGLALSAIQFLPALELTRYSVREALTYEWVSIFSLPPEHLLTLLVPDFFGDLVAAYWGKNYLWEMSLYLGVVPLAMAAAAVIFDRSRTVIIFTLIAAVSLILALGKHTPLLHILYHTVPGFNLFRGLSKFAFVFAFAVAILAGYGLTKIMALERATFAKLRGLSLVLAGIALALLFLGFVKLLVGQSAWHSLIELFLQSQDRFLPLPTLSEKYISDSMFTVFKSLIATSILLIAVAGLLWARGRFRRLSARAFMVLIVGIATFDLWLFGSRYLPTFDPRDLSMDRELKAFFQQEKESFRVATAMFELLNVGLLEGIENVGGYDAIVLKDYSQFINFTQGLPLDEPNIAMEISRISPLLRLFANFYVLDPSTQLDHPEFNLVFQNQRYKVYKDSRALPRAFIVHDVRTITDGTKALAMLTAPEFNPSSTALIEASALDLPNHPNLASAKSKIISRSLNRVVIEAETTAPGLLVLADAYYPGWQVSINGKESRIHRTNRVMRGVVLPKGRHTVEFRYQPKSFQVGAMVSLVSIILLVGCLITLKVRA